LHDKPPRIPSERLIRNRSERLAAKRLICPMHLCFHNRCRIRIIAVNLRHLRTFVAIADAGGVRRAATGPPPMKWSDSKYGVATEEDCNGEEAQA
jgi:hypothetical protein